MGCACADRSCLLGILEVEWPRCPGSLGGGATGQPAGPLVRGCEFDFAEAAQAFYHPKSLALSSAGGIQDKHYGCSHVPH